MTTRGGPRAQSRPGGRGFAMLRPARIRCHRRRGPAGRGRRSAGPTRPEPVKGWCRRPAKHQPGRDQGQAPSPRYTAPGPRAPSLGWWSGGGAPTGRGAGLRERDVLAAEVTSGKAIIGNSRQYRRASRPRACRPRASSTGGLAGRQGAGVVVNAMPRFRCRRRHGRDDAGRTPACDRASTDHVWITIWCRHGCGRLPDLPAAHQATRICAGNRSGGRQGRSGHVSLHCVAILGICTVHPQACAPPHKLLTSPGSA